MRTTLRTPKMTLTVTAAGRSSIMGGFGFSDAICIAKSLNVCFRKHSSKYKPFFLTLYSISTGRIRLFEEGQGLSLQCDYISDLKCKKFTYAKSSDLVARLFASRVVFIPLLKKCKKSVTRNRIPLSQCKKSKRPRCRVCEEVERERRAARITANHSDSDFLHHAKDIARAQRHLTSTLFSPTKFLAYLFHDLVYYQVEFCNDCLLYVSLCLREHFATQWFLVHLRQRAHP